MQAAEGEGRLVWGTGGRMRAWFAWKVEVTCTCSLLEAVMAPVHDEWGQNRLTVLIIQLALRAKQPSHLALGCYNTHK